VVMGKGAQSGHGKARLVVEGFYPPSRVKEGKLKKFCIISYRRRSKYTCSLLSLKVICQSKGDLSDTNHKTKVDRFDLKDI